MKFKTYKHTDFSGTEWYIRELSVIIDGKPYKVGRRIGPVYMIDIDKWDIEAEDAILTRHLKSQQLAHEQNAKK